MANQTAVVYFPKGGAAEIFANAVADVLAIFLASGVAIDEPERSEEKFLEPLIRKYGLEPAMCDAFPGYVPGHDEFSPETVDPEIARHWAKTLAKTWS